MNLLALTALIAIGTAAGIAYQKNRTMVRYREDLLGLSSRLSVDQDDILASAQMPRVADDFHSWKVHVPSGQNYELRLGVGEVSERGIPPILDRVPISGGRHRVTLQLCDSSDKEFLYVVYVDGKRVLEKTMGSEWMPNGWSTASSINWPRDLRRSPAPLPLSGRRYKPRLDFGKGSGHYFNGDGDNYVTLKGYRLWIDQADRKYEPASPFIGFADDPDYLGIGLRDGLRYKSTGNRPYDWHFTRPSLDTDDPVLRIAAEFFARDGSILSSQTPSFQSWQLQSDPDRDAPLSWTLGHKSSTYTAFLKAKSRSNAPSLSPVIEMKWDADRPDEVGLRLADFPENRQLDRWRLRILGGKSHLWREITIGERTLNAPDFSAQHDADRTEAANELDLEIEPTEDARLCWQTNEPLPLQILERKDVSYAAMQLYQGLPPTFGIEIPATLKPTMTATVLEERPNDSGQAFPGGSVFSEIAIELRTVEPDWIWFKVEPKL